MIYNLNELNIKKEILINSEVFIDNSIDKRIFGLNNAFVKGSIYKDVTGDVILKCKFTGSMLIEDSITLDKVPYEFSIDIEENLEYIKENYENCYDKNKNTLDLIKVLWQNIVLEVPISYTKVIDANLKGNGWELNSQEDDMGIDPRLKKLEELLKGDD